MKFNENMSSGSQGSMWTNNWTGLHKKIIGWFS